MLFHHNFFLKNKNQPLQKAYTKTLLLTNAQEKIEIFLANPQWQIMQLELKTKCFRSRFVLSIFRYGLKDVLPLVQAFLAQQSDHLHRHLLGLNQ